MQHLITGGAGFVGSHLADRLVDRGDRVVVLDDLSTGRRENLSHLLESGRVQLIEGSTSDFDLVDELMRGCDQCFHLASAVGVKLVVEGPLESLLGNVRGSDAVMGAAVRHGVRLLFTSTSEVYGKHSTGALHEESDRLLGPVSKSRWGYANSKAFGEMLAFGYAREHGAKMTVVRLFNTVGPRQSGLYGMVLPRFVQQAIAGDPLTVYGDGMQSRCFTHVSDAIDAIVGLAEADAASGRAFNIGTSQEMPILELATRVIERVESTSQVVFIPFDEAYEDGFEELGRRKPDAYAIEQQIGWRPRRTIEDAIDDVLRYQRHALGLVNVAS